MVARPAARGVRLLFPPSAFPAAQAVPGLFLIILPRESGVNVLSRMGDIAAVAECGRISGF